MGAESADDGYHTGILASVNEAQTLDVPIIPDF